MIAGEVSIRPVARGDYHQWLPLWEGYNAFYERTGPTALPPQITAMTWARFFDAYEPVHGLVAQSDGRLIGLTTICSIAAPPRSNRSATSRICSPARPRGARAWAGR